MTNEELEAYLLALGWRIEQRVVESQTFVIIHEYVIPSGGLAGRTCDVALARPASVPYVAPL